MNEEVREYAKSYIIPPKTVYPSFYEAVKAWGQEEGLTGERLLENGSSDQKL